MKTTFLLNLFMAAMVLSGCATKVLLPHHLDALPRNEGINMLSVAVEPWQYLDSDEWWHRFRYQWFDRDNQRHARTVKFRHDLVRMPFTQARGAGKARPMTPVLSKGRIVAFERKEWTRLTVEWYGRACVPEFRSPIAAYCALRSYASGFFPSSASASPAR